MLKIFLQVLQNFFIFSIFFWIFLNFLSFFLLKNITKYSEDFSSVDSLNYVYTQCSEDLFEPQNQVACFLNQLHTFQSEAHSEKSEHFWSHCDFNFQVITSTGILSKYKHYCAFLTSWCAFEVRTCFSKHMHDFWCSSNSN